MPKFKISWPKSRMNFYFQVPKVENILILNPVSHKNKFSWLSDCKHWKFSARKDSKLNFSYAPKFWNFSHCAVALSYVKSHLLKEKLWYYQMAKVDLALYYIYLRIFWTYALLLCCQIKELLSPNQILSNSMIPKMDVSTLGVSNVAAFLMVMSQKVMLGELLSIVFKQV